MPQQATGKLTNNIEMEKTDRVKCLDRAIANGAAINDSLFCSLMADYPYFLPAMVMRMQDGSLTDSQRQQLLAGAATTIGNREDLFYLVGNDGSAIRIHNTETDNKTKSTMDTISHFLDTFGNNDDAETRALEQRRKASPKRTERKANTTVLSTNSSRAAGSKADASRRLPTTMPTDRRTKWRRKWRAHQSQQPQSPTTTRRC